MKDAYESMFGTETITKADHVVPNILPMHLNKPLIRAVMEQAKKEHKWVLAFIIGTKPCFYKFYGSIVAAAKSKTPFFIINSNQHYDDILTHGIKEFNFQDKIASNLSIRGDLAQKSAELMIKVSWLAKYLKKRWPDVTVIPVVLGDTIMTSIVPAAWMFSRNEKAIQNEAGLRSMTPEVMKMLAVGLAVGLCMVGPALALCISGFAALQSFARDPEASGPTLKNMFVIGAFAEAIAIYVLIVAIILAMIV